MADSIGLLIMYGGEQDQGGASGWVGLFPMFPNPAT